MKNKTAYKFGLYVDNTWRCGCGALNAAYRDKCGKCERAKDLASEK